MSSQPGNAFEAMGREDLLRALEMFAKNWLAHDGGRGAFRHGERH